MIGPQIRNIIFDFGGVILNLDYNKTSQAFKNLGLQQFDSLYTQLRVGTLFTDLECGRIEPADFEKELNRQGGVHLTSEQITTAWNAMLLDLPLHRIQLLHRLKTRYRTFLLSNTNAIHHREFARIYQACVGKGSLEDCFEKAYYSHTMGLRKPDKECYESVLQENNLKAEETLFIDDTLPNIDAALALGIECIYLQPPNNIETIFA